MQERRVIGQAYEEAKLKWPQGADYRYTRQGHELRLFLYRPTQAEIESVSVGRAELALTVEKSVLFLLYRFAPHVPWGGAPYTWWSLTADEQPRVLPALTPDTRTPLQVHVVDAATGIFRAVRTINLSPVFTNALELALRTHLVQAQQGNSLTENEYKERIADIHQTYPHPELMLPNAIATYQSGQ
ncbi:MAG: hypothetical protein JO316_25110 [Abitibacteriaceae bacterium]|nr:hypothetical protein [Abditibacteriaceae bacterium]MBV9868649.1 hypothetical protein [Abditibacteriaceae bacterium]